MTAKNLIASVSTLAENRYVLPKNLPKLAKITLSEKQKNIGAKVFVYTVCGVCFAVFAPVYYAFKFIVLALKASTLSHYQKGLPEEN